MVYQKKPRHECGITAQAYAREIAQCALADERMKEIDYKIALMTPQERQTRRNRIAADRMFVRQGTPEWMEMMQDAEAEEEWMRPWMEKIAARAAKRTAWLNSEIGRLPSMVKS